MEKTTKMTKTTEMTKKPELDKTESARLVREGREHELKTWPIPFEAVVDGRKRYEIRKNDRNFEVGDTLWLREWNDGKNALNIFAASGYTGREIRVRIVYMSHGGMWGLPDDLCVMSIAAEHDGAAEADRYRRAAEVERLTKERDEARAELANLKQAYNRECQWVGQYRGEARQLESERDVALARVRELESRQPACGERSPVPWFTACVRPYPHDGQHDFRPLQSLYDKQRCESCGSDSKVWGELTTQVRELELTEEDVAALRFAKASVKDDMERLDRTPEDHKDWDAKWNAAISVLDRLLAANRTRGGE